MKIIAAVVFGLFIVVSAILGYYFYAKNPAAEPKIAERPPTTQSGEKNKRRIYSQSSEGKTAAAVSYAYPDF